MIFAKRRVQIRTARRTIDFVTMYFIVGCAANGFLDEPRSIERIALMALITGLPFALGIYWNLRSKGLPDPRLRDGTHKQSRSLF